MYQTRTGQNGINMYLSHKKTLPVSWGTAILLPLRERSRAPSTAAPASAWMLPNPRRSMRAMPALDAMPLPAHAPQLMLTPTTPCNKQSVLLTQHKGLLYLLLAKYLSKFVQDCSIVAFAVNIRSLEYPTFSSNGIVLRISIKHLQPFQGKRKRKIWIFKPTFWIKIALCHSIQAVDNTPVTVRCVPRRPALHWLPRS